MRVPSDFLNDENAEVLIRAKSGLLGEVVTSSKLSSIRTQTQPVRLGSTD